MNGNHVHVGWVHMLGFVAALYATNFLVRTFVGHHNDNPAIAGLIPGF